MGKRSIKSKRSKSKRSLKRRSPKRSLRKRDKDVYIEMRKFHNKIKSDLYSKYAKNAKSLLELSSGKGGDLHKWVKNNIKSILGIDINKAFIKESYRRLQESYPNKNLDYTFIAADLLDTKTIKWIPRDHFDVVMCHFAFHYYWGNKRNTLRIIKMINKALKPGGHFVATIIDNTRVDKMKTLNTDSYDIKVGKPKVWGRKLRMTLKGDNYLSDGSDEYLIDFKQFVDLMREHGYRLVETKLFKNIKGFKSLKDFQKDISGLNRYVVFKRIN